MSRLLHQGVRAQAERRPEAVALVCQNQKVTYGELEQRSNQLARLLRAAGCRRGDRVLLMLPKSPPAIIGMLGILKADAIYVPLDTTSPPVRAARILEQCEPRLLLAGGPGADLLEKLRAAGCVPPSVRTGWMEPGHPLPLDATAFVWGDLEAFSSESLEGVNQSSDPAHILFTSGSTGVPKGVVITHSSVLHFVDWALGHFRPRPEDRISGHPPLHFDLSTFDIYGTFAAGAQLHLVPPEMSLLPHKLAEFMRASRLTQWFSVPSILNHMAKFDVLRQGDFPELQRLLWCGETFPTPALIYWMKRLPHVRFTNLYGPTEATIASSFYDVPSCPKDEQTPIPIGAPCAGEDLLVLDDELRPAAPGEIGNLFIRGVGLSPGYWRDPEKTKSVFLPNPHSSRPQDRIYRTGDLARIGEDGLLYLVGRADSQIKSRGYRIELGEIEAALHAIAGLQEAAVVAIESPGFQGLSIACAYSPAAGADLPPRVVRKRLAELVPHYMIPAQWLVLDRLPLNGSGKIDRRKLQEQFRQHEAPAVAGV
jgi:amino acid adenylation domain-containing protein